MFKLRLFLIELNLSIISIYLFILFSYKFSKLIFESIKNSPNLHSIGLLEQIHFKINLILLLLSIV